MNYFLSVDGVRAYVFDPKGYLNLGSRKDCQHSLLRGRRLETRVITNSVLEEIIPKLDHPLIRKSLNLGLSEAIRYIEKLVLSPYGLFTLNGTKVHEFELCGL